MIADQTHMQANKIARLLHDVVVFATATYARFAGAIGSFLICAYVLITAASVLIEPEANWDMLPYIAIAAEGTHPGAAALHGYAYGAVKQGVTTPSFEALTKGDVFRQHMSDMPDDFVSLLGMYRVKILYVKALGALLPFMAPVSAIHAISVFSTLAFGLFALLWLRSLQALALAPFAAAVMMMAGFGDAARVGTPDMLCAALFTGAMYAYVRKHEFSSAILFYLAFLARPDNVVFVCLFAVLIFIFKIRAPGVLLAFASSLISYFLISHWAGHPGWWPHLYFSTISQQFNMSGFQPSFSAALYFKAFAKAVYHSLEYNSWVGVVVLASGLWLMTHIAGFTLQMREGVAFAALGLSIAAKFVVFPIHDTRVYFAALIPLLLLVLPSLQAFGRAAFAGAQPISIKGKVI
jgi:hypothetical protein